MFFLLAARPDTYDIQEQPPAITYTDKYGRARNHHFDFLLAQRNGLRLAIAVKSAGIVERRGFREELKLIRAATPLSFAKEVVLVTDRSFSRAEALNAERLHEFRRVPDPDADAAIERGIGRSRYLSETSAGRPKAPVRPAGREWPPPSQGIPAAATGS
ncbi:hypothetical protein [Paracoccus sanguinis]|uniref:hypothetical protein n=1 Tax=Paracoccus sanguinis TaxID=1545044 RepID=UPI0012E05F6D